METPRGLLLLLFSLFWAQLLSTTGRYNAFPTASLFNPAESGKLKKSMRFLVSFLMLNLFPIGWLYFLWRWIVSDQADTGFLAFAGAALAALSIFGWLRLYHAIVASSYLLTYFYTDEEMAQYEIQGPSKTVRPHYAHWIPGLVYMVVLPMAAYFVARMNLNQ